MKFKEDKTYEVKIFFIRDKVDEGKMSSASDAPTIRKMGSDMLMKPIHSTAFCVDRPYLMNVAKDYDDKIECKGSAPELLPKIEKIDEGSQTTPNSISTNTSVT